MNSKLIKLTLIPALSLLLLLGGQSQAAGIEFFHGSFADAKAEAAESGKLIFMDAFAVWCGPCKWMAANSFTDEKVGDFFNRNFINVKMDMERGEGPDLARQYGVSAYPTLFFFDATGEVVQKETGARDARGLLQLAERVLRKHSGTSGQHAEAAAPDSDTPDAEVDPEVDSELESGLPEELEEIIASLSNAIDDGDQSAFDGAIADLRLTDYPEKDFIFVEAQVVWMENQGSKEEFAEAVIDYIADAPQGNSHLLLLSAAYFWELDLPVNQLRLAQSWAEQSIAIAPGYYNHDINAMLLHKLGKTRKAIAEAEKALEYAKEEGIDASDTEAFLAEVQN